MKYQHMKKFLALSLSDGCIYHANNVKMTTIVGSWHFNIYERDRFHVVVRILLYISKALKMLMSLQVICHFYQPFFMPPKELWEAYSYHTVRLSVPLHVRCISPFFFEVEIPNLVCRCIFGRQSVAYYFRVTVTLTSDLVYIRGPVKYECK